ncbi:hypothetical protein KFE98_00440 [bacterium SCSIO 12741]|nr:hypothetical protein KFE98_00440 [bacterium SCSIO 12741]
MNNQICDIWIESEEKGAILGGTLESNDNSDVIVTFKNKSRYVASFFTYRNIEYLRKKNQKSGECLDGRFFWASNMIIVERICRAEIEEIINHLLSIEEFNLIFNQVQDD